MKKRMVLIAIIIIALVAVTMIYQTFATGSGTSSNNVYTVTLGGSSEKLVIPANSNKTIIYQITNTNKGVVQYGIVYSGKNITVKVFDDSDDLVTGTIDYGESKFVKLYVENTGTSSSTLNIKAVLGYENGGSLEESKVVPEDHEFVTETYVNLECTSSNTLMCNIINLYKNNNPTQITQYRSNGTTEQAKYFYSYMDNEKTWGIMNDGLGATINDTTALTNGTQGNIRYYGANPNNYIYFNCDDYNIQSASTCEKWRIIGIVDGKVKIIRDESLGDYSWDYTSTGNYNNNWHDSTLQVLLNNGYYNNSDGVSYYNGVYNYVTDDYSAENIIINFKEYNKGIKNDETRKLISESTWYLGGHDSSSIYVNQIYGYERGTNDSSNTSSTWTGKIGLMYPSDYGYAADLSVCNQPLHSYKNTNCTGTDWLFNSNWQWLIAPSSVFPTNAFYVNSDSRIDHSSYPTYHVYGVRAVLYLDSKLTLKNDGNGSYNKPYQIDVE